MCHHHLREMLSLAPNATLYRTHLSVDISLVLVQFAGLLRIAFCLAV
jgi:hypothetical protein